MRTVFFSTDENRSLFIEAIIKYLNGTHDIKNTKNALHLACTYETDEIDAKTFAKKIRLFKNSTDTELDPQIVEILRHLNLDTEKRTYTDQGIIYLYDVLRKQKDKDLEYLIELIDDIQPSGLPRIYYILPPAVGAIGFLSFCYFQPQYFWLTLDWILDMLPVVYHWAYHYVIQLHNLPFIGMGMQIIWLFYYLYNTFEHGKDPSEEKIRSLIFRTAALFLNFMAHLLTYWAAGTLSLAPALFFFSSSLVGIVESIYTYRMRKKPEINDRSDVHAKAWFARYNVKQDRDYYLFLIRLMYAITISALLVAWTVLPPSAIFTMVYMLTMWVVTLLKDYYISDRKHYYANEEQSAVSAVYIAEANNSALRMEADKETFKIEALRVMQQFIPDTAKQEMLQKEMLSQLQTNPFKLDHARKEFEKISEVCRKYNLTPSPQHATPLRTHSMYAAAPSPSMAPANRRLDLEDLHTNSNTTSRFSSRKSQN